GDSGFYSLVLNGMRSDINGNQDPAAKLDSEYFTKINGIHSKNTGEFDGWEVTGTDGTVYKFGDLRPGETWDANTHAKAAVSMYLRPDQKHEFDKWYLKEVTDPLGNH